MKILSANNYFYLRGGSERVFFEEADLLERHGHRVVFFSTVNPDNLPCPDARHFAPDIGRRPWQAPRMVYSVASRRRIARLIREERPDIAHLHNVYQRISPSVLHALAAEGVPAVMTLHDYKLVCPSYQLYHHGRLCRDCEGRRFHRAVRNRCKEDSLGLSLVLALEAHVHRALGIWKRLDRLIAPSRFLRDTFVEMGWDPDHIVYIPNFIDLERFSVRPDSDDYFLYAGRLSPEKGVRTLIRAFKGAFRGRRLLIAGEGPMGADLREEAAGDDRIAFLGRLEADALARAMHGARIVVVPSEWYENAPMSVLEAMACGKPVVGADIGGISELVEPGVTGQLFEPMNHADLRGKIDLIDSLDGGRIRRMGLEARRRVEEAFGAESHYERLISLYERLRGEGPCASPTSP